MAGGGRVIVAIDVDSFYAQVEEMRNPHLCGKPLGVTQKYLVVTANYAARERGVTKLTSIEDARRRCPEIVLVPGEDLTPYREVSRKLREALQRFGTVQALGMDEAWVDVTDRAREAPAPECFRGHVLRAGDPLVPDSRHRVQDLRAAGVAPRGAQERVRDVAEELGEDPGRLSLLAAGSHVAWAAREVLRQEIGLRSSAGVAGNKMLAKLASGIHKPDDQTVLPPTQARDFVAPLPIRTLPGVGGKAAAALSEAGLATVAAVRDAGAARLAALVGAPLAGHLAQWAEGRDDSPVIPSGPPKGVSVEDSFRSCSSWEALHATVLSLAPDLAQRLAEERAQGRTARTLVVKWRPRAEAGSGYSAHRVSASLEMPREAAAPRPGPDGDAAATAAIAAAAMRVLRSKLPKTFDLSLLNLGATKFTDSGKDLPAPLWRAKRGAGGNADGGSHGGANAWAPGTTLSKRQRRIAMEASTAVGSSPERVATGGGGPMGAEGSREAQGSVWWLPGGKRSRGESSAPSGELRSEHTSRDEGAGAQGGAQGAVQGNDVTESSKGSLEGCQAAGERPRGWWDHVAFTASGDEVPGEWGPWDPSAGSLGGT